MNHHPTPEHLKALFRGKLDRTIAREIAAHLKQGCQPCEHKVLFLVGELIEAGGGPVLQEPSTTTYDAAISRAFAVVLQHSRRHERQLAALRERRNVIGAAEDSAALTGLYGTGGVAPIQVLLDCAQEVRHDDPQRMLIFTELACKWVELLDPEQLGAFAVADLQARTWAELGNSYRVADRLDEAERALDEAAKRFARGSLNALLEARLLDLRASLRGDQRRFVEAQSLLDRVRGIYERFGERHLAGRALVSKGIYAGYEQRPEEALDWISRGLAQLDRERDPRLTFAAIQSSVRFMLDLGELRGARRELFENRQIFAAVEDGVTRAKVDWMEGQISAGLGELDNAAERLASVRVCFAEMGLTYKAALVGLDLAAVRLQCGQPERVFLLVEEMLATFRALRIGREAIAALVVLRQACAKKRVTVDIIHSVAAFLRTFEQDPSAQFEAGTA